MFYFIIFILLSAVGFLLFLQNSQAIALNILFWRIENISLSIVILTVFVAGFVFGFLIMSYFKIKDHFSIKSLKQEINELKRQISQKNLPLQ